MIIALFCQHAKAQITRSSPRCLSILSKRNVTVVARDDEAKELGISPLTSVPQDQIDFLISLGGDGTILRMVHHFPHLLDKPILGINLGHFGFMADVPLSDLYPSLEELISGEYRIEERVMMEGMTQNKNRASPSMKS